MEEDRVELIPEPKAVLTPPIRRPPTAVGTATLPSPGSHCYPSRHSLTRRVALSLLALLFFLGALPLAWPPAGPARGAAAAGFALAGTDVALQAATGSPHPWREVVAPAARSAIAQLWPLRSASTKQHADRALQPRRAGGSHWAAPLGGSASSQPCGAPGEPTTRS